jgi:flagellar motility protein MotE (MotC chaperone)
MNYHRPGVCEKDNRSLSKVLDGKQVHKTILQLDKCITERHTRMIEKYNGGDTKHKHQLKRLTRLRKKLYTLKKQSKNTKVSVSYRNGKFYASTYKKKRKHKKSRKSI